MYTDAEKAIAYFETVKVKFEDAIAADTEAVIALTAAETELTEAIAAEAAAVLAVSETPSDMASTALALATERLPPVGDELAHDPVVFPAAGIGAMFAEIVHVSSDTDVSLSGPLVEAVFGELFSFVGHWIW